MREDLFVLIALAMCFSYSSTGNPLPRKCVLGPSLLNSLVGNGVRDKDEFAAEEDALGLTGDGPFDGLPPGNLTDEELQDCLKEYAQEQMLDTDIPQLPPGAEPDKNPLEQPYLPYTSGVEETIGERGDYHTTYDGSHYKFKEKGYVISSPPTPPTTPAPPKVKEKRKDEITLWYKAFVSVLSEYI